ncbi:MAG: magnesium transporter [Clostridia bacterium]|nr:magnesium transporter [Clostridia bacterium]
MENEKLLELVNDKKFTQLKKYLLTLNEVDLAAELEKISQPDIIIKVFRLLDKDIAADVFTYLSPEVKQFIIESISEQELKSIMEELYMDDTIDIIESMPANVVDRILKAAKPEKRKEINIFLGYKEETAGGLMTSEYLDLKDDMDISSCFSRIKKLAADKETINTCYVTDNKRKLLGEVSIRDLIMAESTAIVGDVMNKNVISVGTEANHEEVLALFRKYNVNEMPVVDADNRVVGLITIDDAIDIIDENVTEDFHKMAAITPTEESYLKTGVIKHTKSRITWLLLLMISAIFTGMLLTCFEDILSKEILLVAFLPLLMGLAGNCGSQTSALMIRGISLQEISMKDYFKVFFKEAKISLIIGLSLALFNFFRVWIQYNNIVLGSILALTVFSVVIISNIIGFTMPLIAKKLKLDPAVMAGPLITTVLDCIVIFIYFSIASTFISF